MRGSVLQPLRDPAIRRLVLGGAISSYGDALQNAAQGWMAVQLTHSARGVGLFAMFWLMPRALSSLVAGVLVDRHRRSTVLKAAVVAATCMATLFLAFVLSGALSYPVLLVLSMGLGLCAPFEITSRNTLLPTLAPRDQTAAIVAVSFFVMYCAELLGLVTAGLLLSGFGVLGCVGLNLCTYLVYIVLISPLRSTVVARGKSPFLGTFLDGVRFVLRKRKAAIPLIVGALFAVVGFHFDRTTLPLYAVETLHASARTYGLLLAASPLGAVVLLGLFRPVESSAQPARIVGSALMLAVAFLALALTERPATAFALLVCVGAARGIHYNSIATLLQLKVPDVLRGRIFSFYNVSGALYGLGGLIMGSLAPTVGLAVSRHAGALRSLSDEHGLRGILVVAAIVTVACTLMIWRPLRRVAEHENYLLTEDLAELTAKLAEKKKAAGGV